jgi:hypothetical protein
MRVMITLYDVGPGFPTLTSIRDTEYHLPRFAVTSPAFAAAFAIARPRPTGVFFSASGLTLAVPTHASWLPATSLSFLACGSTRYGDLDAAADTLD